MKTHVLFCCLLTFITCCVFTWRAESAAGEVFGYMALVISMIAVGKNVVGKADA